MLKLISNISHRKWVNMERKIIHVDMDAFFAAVEQRDNQELVGKPVIIGGKAQSRGVVSTASYEARKFGVHSAMPLVQAYRLCPQGVFIPPNHKKYSRVSDSIMEIFKFYTPLVEALSLDEAFLDVTGSQRLFGSAEKIAKEIKGRIKSEVGLIASIGIAPNKFLAKIASDLEKPDGFVIVRAEDIEKKIWPLSIKKLWGIGKKSGQKLLELNIKTIGQLARSNPQLLKRTLGSWGVEVHQLANGIDYRPVVPEREAQSIGRERTFPEDITNIDLLKKILLDLSQDVGWRLRRAGLKGRTITIKLKFHDFKTITRSHTLPEKINQDNIIYQEGVRLLETNYTGEKSLRLLGVTVSGFSKEDGLEGQFSLFAERNDKSAELYKALDKVNSKYGRGAITRARLLE